MGVGEARVGDGGKELGVGEEGRIGTRSGREKFALKQAIRNTARPTLFPHREKIQGI